MKKISKYVSICLLVLASLQGHAFNCESQADGPWYSASTWINCNGTYPRNDDNVTIKISTQVTLTSVTNKLESLFVETGGYLIIDVGTPPDVIINANNSMTSTIDLSNASLILKNDLIINANNKNLLIGTVNGDFNLELNSVAETHLTNTIGRIDPIRSLSLDTGGTTFLEDPNGTAGIETIKVNQFMEFNNAVQLDANTYLKCQDGTITFNNTIDASQGSDFVIRESINSIINFNDKIGSMQEPKKLSILNSDGALVNINTSEIRTQEKQRWDLDVVLNSPTQEVLMNSSDGFTIRFGKPSATFSVRSESANTNSLILGTAGPVDIMSNIGDNNQALNNLIIGTPATITLSKSNISVADTLSFVGPVVLENNMILQAGFLEVQDNLDNGGFDLTVDITTNFGSTILGVLSGSGDFIKNGVGEIDFSSVNTLTGNVFINNGRIFSFINSENTIPAVPVISVDSMGNFGLYSGNSSVFQMKATQTIKGTGNLGSMGQSIVLPAGATIEPGFSPGILTASSVAMQSGSQLNIELNGIAVGTEYDQLVVDDIDLDADSNGGATLGLSVGSPLQTGDNFTIIKSTSAISGTFKGLNEGAQINVNGYLFSISYVGGSGNDVVLTVVSTRYYVNANSATPLDGSSWTNAFVNLQDALAVVQEGDEVWVAQGVYYPDEGGTQIDNDQTSSFDLIESVAIYGGFDGTENNRDQREPTSNITILSGDIEQDDVNSDGNFIAESSNNIKNSNSFHIVTGSAVTTQAIIDGFTVTAGKANSVSGDPLDRGAGIYCGLNTSGPSINNVVFIGNYTKRRGAGLYGCSQSINNTSFINNYSDDLAGAVFAFGGEMNNVVFLDNSSTVSAGALLNVGLPLTIINSTFEGNQEYNFDGGAIYTKSDIMLENVLFKGNRAGTISNVGEGGALFVFGASTANLTNVTFSGNRAKGLGGAISISSTATLNIQNSIIWNNLDSAGLGTSSASINIPVGGVLNNSFSLIQGFGTAGVGNLDEDPLFITSTNPNAAPTSAGNAHLTAASPAIDVGDNNLSTELVDLDGGNRVINGTVDLGAYEFLGYTVNVTVEGLNSGTVILQNNGGDDLSFNSNSSQSFGVLLAHTENYSVSILSQSSTPNQNCVISNGSGVINGADVDVSVTCTTLQYNIGVDVSGLANGVTLSLLNNAETLDITSNGLSNFATALDDLSIYAVSITAQPSSPNQQCLITSNNASGNLSGADKVITIECTTLQYTVGVNVLGLANGVTLSVLNNAETLDITSNGLSNFATALDDLSIYAVSITAQPSSPNQQCLITSNNASGNLSGVNEVINIQCTTLQYTVGVNVSGLANGGSLSLLNNAETLEITSNGLSNFATALDDLSIYAVSITSQPSSPNQQCVIISNNASGNLSGADKVITIECTTLQYTIGVNVAGLASGNTVGFENNGEGLSVYVDGQFNFSTALDDGSTYEVTVTSQPTTPNQMCSVVSNTGSLSGSDVLLIVTCTTNQYFVGGMASGLAGGNTVTLSLGAQDLDISNNAAFVFLNPLSDESDYFVSVLNQPTVPNQTCDLVNPTGTIAGNDVTDIEVNCITNQYTVGGTVAGLHLGNNLVIQNNNSDDLTITNSGNFDFVTAIDDLQSYNATILSQPNNPIQPCVISNNTGNVAGSNVTSISIVCEFGDDLIYSGGFE